MVVLSRHGINWCVALKIPPFIRRLSSRRVLLISFEKVTKFLFPYRRIFYHLIFSRCKIVSLFLFFIPLARGMIFNESTSPEMIFLDVGEGFLSRDTWSLYYFYDLTDFFGNLNVFVQASDKLKEICGAVKSNDEIMCRNLQAMIETYKDKCDMNKQFIEGFRQQQAVDSYREKRSMFTLRPSTKQDAINLNNKINLLIKRDNLTSEQVNVIEDALSSQMKRFEEFKNNVNQFNQSLGDVENVENVIQHQLVEEKVNYLVNLCTLLMQQIDRKMENIIKMLSNSKDSSEIFREIVPYNIFKDNIYNMNLRGSQTVPYENIYSLYKIIHVTSQLVENNVMQIRVTIPIIARNVKYKIYRIIPIPMASTLGLVTIQPNFEYFLSSDIDGRHFVPLTAEEYSKCLTNVHNVKICNPSAPEQVDKLNGCEMNAFYNKKQITTYCKKQMKEIPKQNYIIRVNDANKYYLHIFEPMTIQSICLGKVEKKVLTMNGYLTLEKHCIIKSDGFQFVPQDDTLRKNVAFFDKQQLDSNDTIKIVDISTGHIIKRNVAWNHSQLLDQFSRIKNEVPDIKIEPIYHQKDVWDDIQDCINILYRGTMFVLGVGIFYLLLYRRYTCAHFFSFERRNPDTVETRIRI